MNRHEKIKKSLIVSLRVLKYVILGFFALILQYMIISFFMSRISIGEEDESKDVEIYLVNTGVHTDFVVPIQNSIINWDTIFPIKHTLGKDSTCDKISIGWGDKNFFLNIKDWPDLTLPVALTATFGLGGSAIHVVHKKSISSDYQKTKIGLSFGQYKKLCDYIIDNLELKNNQPILIYPKDSSILTQDDAYYESKGSYGMFYTCNTFINNGLYASGKKSAFWTPFAGGIFYHYDD